MRIHPIVLVVGGLSLFAAGFGTHYRMVIKTLNSDEYKKGINDAIIQTFDKCDVEVIKKEATK